MAIGFKDGVSLAGISPQVALGIMICESVYAKHGVRMWVTSVCDGKHGRYSRHYQGMAWDLRVRNIPTAGQRQGIFVDLKKSLGEQFMVLDEGDHFHVSFKPNFVG